MSLNGDAVEVEAFLRGVALGGSFKVELGEMLQRWAKQIADTDGLDLPGSIPTIAKLLRTSATQLEELFPQSTAP